MRTALRRWNTVPFETLFGFLAFFSGILGLLNIGTSTDALDAILGNTFVSIFQVLFILAGVLMLLGIAQAKAWLEGPGIILLVMSVVVRTLAILILYGFDRNIAGVLILYALVVYCSGVRLYTLYRGEIILRADPSQVRFE